MARSLEKRMLAHDFKLIGTGGNCTAYVRNDGEIEEWVTVQGDPSIPTKRRDDVLLVTGTREDIEAGNGDSVGSYTFGDVLDALDSPSDEYHLLSLRLHNNLHKVGGRREFADHERMPAAELSRAENGWRWRKYNGIRIPKEGYRTFVELNFQTAERAYGYVWHSSGRTAHASSGEWCASWEYLKPGEVLDKDLGTFSTQRAARKAVEDALIAEYR